MSAITVTVTAYTQMKKITTRHLDYLYSKTYDVIPRSVLAIPVINLSYNFDVDGSMLSSGYNRHRILPCVRLVVGLVSIGTITICAHCTKRLHVDTMSVRWWLCDVAACVALKCAETASSLASF